ncbi:MAG: hypothetical protein NZ824_11200 [Candidatus Thioglobus sp.]|nr:hypothetical protein [Candidatus Thioglobus sp.]
MTEQILMIIGVAAVGGYITWHWGERKFNEGIIYALCNHHEGTLTYEVYEDEDGEDVLEVTTRAN